MKFRMKPVVIEAVKVREVVDYAAKDWPSVPGWVKEAYGTGKVIFTWEGIDIKTPEGRMMGLMDDWLIQGVNGDVYPCEHDIFEKTHERVEED